jgi:hypothetical protein
MQSCNEWQLVTLLKKRKFSRRYKELQKRSGAKSYIYEEGLPNEEMRKYLTIYEEAVIVKYDFAPDLV